MCVHGVGFQPPGFESFLITHVHAVGLHQSDPPETSKSLPAKKSDPLSFSYHSVHIGLTVAYIKFNHFDACLSSYPLVSTGHTMRSLNLCARSYESGSQENKSTF